MVCCVAAPNPLLPTCAYWFDQVSPTPAHDQADTSSRQQAHTDTTSIPGTLPTQVQPTRAAPAAQPGLDQLGRWADVAREAYAAIDGCLDGFEDGGVQQQQQQQAGATEQGSASLSGAEAEIVKVSTCH